MDAAALVGMNFWVVCVGLWCVAVVVVGCGVDILAREDGRGRFFFVCGAVLSVVGKCYLHDVLVVSTYWYPL